MQGRSARPHGEYGSADLREWLIDMARERPVLYALAPGSGHPVVAPSFLALKALVSPVRAPLLSCFDPG
jgi:hypothetical protein